MITLPCRHCKTPTAAAPNTPRPSCVPCETRACDDCKAAPSTVEFGMGARRCTPCAEVFIKAWRDKQYAEERQRIADHKCGETDDVCSECCEHWETDHGVCMDCGEDRMEDLMAYAYDSAKAARYE